MLGWGTVAVVSAELGLLCQLAGFCRVGVGSSGRSSVITEGSAHSPCMEIQGDLTGSWIAVSVSFACFHPAQRNSGSLPVLFLLGVLTMKLCWQQTNGIWVCVLCSAEKRCQRTGSRLWQHRLPRRAGSEGEHAPPRGNRVTVWAMLEIM